MSSSHSGQSAHEDTGVKILQFNKIFSRVVVQYEQIHKDEKLQLPST